MQGLDPAQGEEKPPKEKPTAGYAVIVTTSLFG
jgi:hypothetical protein